MSVKTPLSLLFLVATAAISVLLGALRGVSVRVSQREGLAFLRYTGVTVVLWVVTLAIKFGANLTLGAIDPKDTAAVGNTLLLTLGLGILAEGFVVLYRALRNDHRVMWAQGQDGAPHRMSPFLDNLRRNMTNRADYPYDNYRVSGWKTRPDQLRDYRRRRLEPQRHDHDGTAAGGSTRTFPRRAASAVPRARRDRRHHRPVAL
jgi:hypothetical protein